MSNDSARPHQDPESEYLSRLKILRETETRYKQTAAKLGPATLLFLAISVVSTGWIVTTRISAIYWVLLPISLLIFFAIAHERVIRTTRKCSRKITFYERNLARIANKWMGTGEAGDRFSDPSHPYARDLDIFGSGSLFELLCTARTRAGEEILAKWLLAPAPPDEVRLRNAAVSELRTRLDLREDLAVLGKDFRSGVQPEALSAWGEGSSTLQPGTLQIISALLAFLWICGLLVWAIFDRKYPALLISVVNLGLASMFRRQTSPSASAIEESAHDLKLLSQVLARIEQEKFSSSKLMNLHAVFRKDRVVASRSIARLNRLVDFLVSRRHMAVQVLDPFVLWSLQWTLAIEAWRKKYGPAIKSWLVALGEIEALSDLAGYAYEHPHDVFPEFTDEAPLFDAEGLAHPLIPESRAIRNDVILGSNLRLIIISGPNMAGKSTFIRSVGINAVLAQCGAPVRAHKLRLSRLAVGASVCVLDSLQGGISRFYAEITRLKVIADLTNGPLPVLFLLDELLQGTNSHDRRIGAEAVVRNLLKRGAVGLLTTHDLALAEIAVAMGATAANFHFEDHLEDGKLRFDHRLSPGIVQTSNALQLMRSIGLDV
jgi:MutS-like protein